MTLRARAIRVTLGKHEVLHGLDMDAHAGAVTAIIGPNGSGKSTLLRALTGEIAPGGTVHLNGDDISDLPGWMLAARRAVLPQASALAFPFTVAEVVRLGLRAGPEAADTSIPSRALARVGLTGFEHRHVQELSGGEQQRVHLARILAQVWTPILDGVPRWLFLDEPVSALDIAHQLAVMEVAAEFARAGGGVIAVMHDLNLTAMVANRVVLLAEGRIVARGTPGDVLTDAHLARAYGCPVRVGVAPPGPFILPQSVSAP